eukprot:scaffold690_cov76-Skeletonema_dohrnii-CCMP3373.AAC.3
MSSKSTIAIGEFYEPAAEEISMEDLDTSCVPPDASSAAMVANSKEESMRPTLMLMEDDSSQRPKPKPGSESEHATFESRPDDEFNRRLLAKAAMAADLKGEAKRPTFMEDDSSQPTPSSDSAAFDSYADGEFNRKPLAKAAMAVASKGENTRPPIMEDSQRPEPGSDSEYVTFESRPDVDDEFNRRLREKAAMAADLKGEAKRPTVMEDDSSQPTPSSSDSTAFESRPDDEFNKRLRAKAAMAADLKGEAVRPTVKEDDSSLLRSYNSINCGDEESKKIAAAPQPPTQDVMEKVDDGNDAALRPFNSEELEDESEPKIELGKESTDEEEEEGQRDSLHDSKIFEASQRSIFISESQKTAASFVYGNEAVGATPFFRESQKSEANVSVSPIIEAYLVEDEGGSGGASWPRYSVYEATPLEPELPWWKQRRAKVFMVINCILITALAVGLGATFSRSQQLRGDVDAPTADDTTAAPNTCQVPLTDSTLDPYDMSTVHELVIDFTDTFNEKNWDFALLESWICGVGMNSTSFVPCIDDGSIGCVGEDGSIPDGLDPTYVTATITYDGVEDSGDETGVRYRDSSTFLQNIGGICGGSNLCECNCMEPTATLPAGCKFPLALSLDKRIGGVERMILNNLMYAGAGGSHIHDALARSMLNNVVRNRRFSFVRVSIGPDTTGEFIDLGVYLNLEHLDSEYTERKTLSVDPFRYEGTMNFNESPASNCESLAGTYEPKGGEDNASSRNLLQLLDELVDVDNLLWNLAFFYLVGENDGNEHEAFLDTFHSHVNDNGYASGRLEWVASDLDRSFAVGTLGLTDVQFHNNNEIIPALLQNENMMLRLEHHIRYLLKKEFNQEVFEFRGLALKDLLVPELGSYFESGTYCDDEPLFGITPPGCEDQLAANNDKFQSVLNDIIDFVNERRAYVLSDLAALSMEEPVVSSVSHSPLKPSSVEEVTITANVEAAGGGSIKSVTLYWRTRGGFESVEMSLGGDIWSVTLPPQAMLEIVEYYVKAVQASAGEESSTFQPPTAAQKPTKYAVGPPGGWVLGPRVVFNEVSGKKMDWIEIYNPTSNPINLAGYYLNKGGMPGEGFFFDPSFGDEYLIVASMGFMVVYADMPAPTATPLVTNFSVDADGDVLTLYKADLLVDFVRFGRTFKNMSRGRAWDGSPDWVEKYEPTPCASNGMLGDLNEDGVVGQDSK